MKPLIQHIKEEKIGGLIIERSLTESEKQEQIRLWNLLSNEEQLNRYDKYISNCRNATNYIKSIKETGLLYFCLDKDFKILYIGSSKDISNDRLLQNDRMRTKNVKPEKITANYIGWEYGERIQFIVKFIVSNYRNYESHLIKVINPEFNSNCTKNYCSK